MEVQFWFDVVCPFAYFASTRVTALAARAGATVRWRPMLLGGLYRSLGVPDVAMDALPTSKIRFNTLDIERRGAQLDVPVCVPQAHPRRTVDAMRLLVAVDDARVPELAAVLFRAYWVQGLDITDRGVLQALADPFGLDVERVIADPAVRQGLFDATAEAFGAGVFGAPTFGVGPRLIWGVDRMHFLAQALGLGPHAPTLEFFHDFASPFSYLAATQVRRVAHEAGAHLVHTPILLGALFREIGTPMVPLHTFSAARQAWQRQDMADWADWWGVPFRFPSTFPLRTVHALRVSLIEPAAIAPMYRAAWAEDRDIGDPDILADVLTRSGWDGGALLEQTQSPSIKATLRANTARAVSLGICGVPTFRVADGELFWGQDRLDQVARALRP